MGTITATFNRYTDDQDTTETYLRDHSGERVAVLGEVPLGEYDRNEVGVMHRIAFPDGHEADAFNDELTEWRLQA